MNRRVSEDLVLRRKIEAQTHTVPPPQLLPNQVPSKKSRHSSSASRSVLPSALRSSLSRLATPPPFRFISSERVRERTSTTPATGRRTLLLGGHLRESGRRRAFTPPVPAVSKMESETATRFHRVPPCRKTSLGIVCALERHAKTAATGALSVHRTFPCCTPECNYVARRAL